MFATVDQPGVGRVLMPGSPLMFGLPARLPPAPAPRLGADTDAVLSSVLGLPDHALAALHDRRVVAGADGA